MSDQEEQIVVGDNVEKDLPEGEDAAFDMSLKKKKKKKEKKDDGEGDGDADGEKKKKKKKEKKDKKSDEEDEGKEKKKKKEKKESAEADGEEFDFGEKKKKKKKEKSKAADSDDNADGDDSLENIAAKASPYDDVMGRKDSDGGDNSNDEDGDDDAGSGLGDMGSAESMNNIPPKREDEIYSYHELLQRVFNIIRQKNPELAGEKKRYTIAPPQVHREGSKKSVFANLVDICRRMHRQPDHVIQYLFAELGTTGSVDGNQRLVIRGKFQQKQIENVLKRYIMEYVTCKTCKSPETSLTKENRLYFLHCESCGSTRTVAAIKTGFQAQTSRRAAQRAAA